MTSKTQRRRAAAAAEADAEAVEGAIANIGTAEQLPAAPGADADPELEAALSDGFEPEAEQTAPAPADKAPKADTKLGTVTALLQRPEGASLAEMMQATGWQKHTVRGALAGALKKKHGFTIDSEKPEGGERRYRIASNSLRSE